MPTRPIMPTEERFDKLGAQAYISYCDTRQWKSFNGDPLPKWPDVKPDIKAGWIAAAKGVLDTLNNRCSRCFEPLEHQHPVTSTVIHPVMCNSCGRDHESYQ